MRKFQQRVFSGVQPTGTLHLGNYLGAIKNFVDLQNKFECVYCVVDQHAITVDQDPHKLRSSIIEVLASFIACGVDYKNQIIFKIYIIKFNTCIGDFDIFCIYVVSNLIFIINYR